MITDSFAENVYIIDDSQRDRENLANALRQQGYLPAVWHDGSKFLDQLDELLPGYVFLDVRMPGIDGLIIAEKLFEHRTKYPVIMVSAHSDVATAVAAMKKGAYDFIEKPWTLEHILSALHYVRTSVCKQLRGQHDNVEKRKIMNKITPREAQVLRLLIKGAQNKYIAFNLGIAERTVEMHRSRLMKRLEVKSFAELIRIAVKAGIGDEDAREA